MRQEIQVLKCFNCDLFQADIVKKSNKWQCKVCNLKQTVRREYDRGCGVTCRAKVQDLNMRNSEEHKIKNDQLLNSEVGDEYDWDVIDSVERNEVPNMVHEKSDYKKVRLGADTENYEQNMFNYSSTQKWSRAAIETVSNTVKVSKKSKWESYS